MKFKQPGLLSGFISSSHYLKRHVLSISLVVDVPLDWFPKTHDKLIVVSERAELDAERQYSIWTAELMIRQV